MAVRLKHKNILLPVICSFVCIAHASYATEDSNNFELSPEQLLDATVTSASKAPERLKDAPAAIFVLTNEDIIRSGATSVPEALRLVPGVQVAQINANSWAVGVRGFNSGLDDKLLVLVDGRSVYDPLFSGVHWDAQDMVLEDIDRIEVIRGPGASLWGANAVNGVINIITKAAKDTQGNLASVTTGNQQMAIIEERYGGKIGQDGEDGYWRMYGKYRDVNDNLTPTGGDAHDGLAQARSGFRADLNGSSPRDTYTVQGDIYEDNASNYFATPTLVPPYNLTQVQDLTEKGANVLARWNRQISDDSRFMLQSYVDYNSFSELLLTDRRTTFDLEAQYDLPQLDRHKITLGSDYRYSADDLGASSFVSFPSAYEQTQLFSGFVQDKITLVPKSWFLTLGTKVEHNDYTGFEVEPNARLQWIPDENQMVWTAVSRAVRTPSRLEHDLTVNESTIPPSIKIPVPVDLILQADPNFDSEDLVAYELGYRRQITPTLSADIAAFYNDYSNLSTDSLLLPIPVLTSPIHYILPFEFTNDSSGETHGVEVTADWRALKTLKFSASYSLLEIDLHGPPSTTAIASQAADTQSPAHQFNVAARWDVTHDITWDTTLYYVSSLPDFDLKSYWRLDTRYGWRIIDGLQFSLVGQNLLQAEHQEFNAATTVGATEIPRSVLGTLTWRY